MARYYHGIWYSAHREGGADWLCSLFKEKGRWQIEQRFRYYKDDKVFGSKDKKNWIRKAAPDDSEEQLQRALWTLEQITKVLQATWGDVEFVDMQCMDDDPKFFFELGSREWTHLKRESKEEAKKMGLTGEEDEE